jgi:hypothetical protein
MSLFPLLQDQGLDFVENFGQLAKDLSLELLMKDDHSQLVSQMNWAFIVF